MELLLEKGYEVHGLIRRSSTRNTHRIDHLLDDIKLIPGDMTDQGSLDRIIHEGSYHEIYNLAAQSYVAESWSVPVYTAEVDAIGATRILEAIRHYSPKSRFYQASSSEMFGKVHEVPQSEKTPFHPRSPYGVAKAYAHYITQNYRESFGLWACSGILFNHESPRRGQEFVTKKIAQGVASIAKGHSQYITLGNLDAKRDWGHAKDYMRAVWMMLQGDRQPKDYVVATGKTHTVMSYLTYSLEAVGLPFDEKYIKIDPALIRPAEVDILLGDPTEIGKDLGWFPEISFQDLVTEMVEFELK